jgi:hypothetical protein
MTRDKWILEIYRPASKSPMATHEFNSLASLRIAIVENLGNAFVVRAPEHATAADRTTLLDLRAQGFDIAIRSSSIH